MIYTGAFHSYRNAAIPLIDKTDITFTEAVVGILKFSEVAVIDTGADLSSIPGQMAQHYRLPVTDQEWLTYPDGSQQWRDVYLLRVGVRGLADITERFVDYGFREITLGRPILNKWRIVLDPCRKYSITELEIVD